VKILYVGPDFPGSNGACWRDAFAQLGHEVRTIDDERYDPIPVSIPGKLLRKRRGRPKPELVSALNSAVLRQAAEFQPGLVFFAKAYHIEPDTLHGLGRISPRMVYMNDDMFNPANQTPTFAANVPLFDFILTTKSYNVREFRSAGAQSVAYVPNAYDPRIHFPAQPDTSERLHMSGDIAFIGMFRPDRADELSRIARLSEWKLNVWGGGWQKMDRLDNLHKSWSWRCLKSSVHAVPLWCAEMGKAIQCNSISLGLLNRQNRDLQTSRSFEIPACGGFMLAERTEEHRMYFEEDREAAYFGSWDELIQKLRFYAAHERPRTEIAREGYRRCLRSPYRYLDRAVEALALLEARQIWPAASAS